MGAIMVIVKKKWMFIPENTCLKENTLEGARHLCYHGHNFNQTQPKWNIKGACRVTPLL